jgi:hypothetical protein
MGALAASALSLPAISDQADSSLVAVKRLPAGSTAETTLNSGTASPQTGGTLTKQTTMSSDSGNQQLTEVTAKLITPTTSEEDRAKYQLEAINKAVALAVPEVN